ncbi:hypothetical protein [Psychrobacillus phage Perkons]|nr:hypothetical protein [Psychrobacillus phage Perkons]
MELQIKINDNWIDFKNVTIMDYNFLDTDFLFLLNNEIKASGQLRIDYTDIYIDFIETTEKRKGYGKMFIEYLKQQKQVERITGQSTEEAYIFWESMNAVLNHRTYKEEGVYSFYI